MIIFLCLSKQSTINIRFITSINNDGRLGKFCKLGKHHVQIVAQGIGYVNNILDKMLKCRMKVDVKKDVCHFALVIKVQMQHFFLENNPQILTMQELAKAQQASTSKVNALELKDRLQITKHPLRPFGKSLMISPKLERKGQRTSQHNVLDFNEEEETLNFKRRQMKRTLNQILEVISTFTIPRQQPQEQVERLKSI